MLSRYRIAFLFMLLASYPVCLDAANFSQCFAAVSSCANDSGSQTCLSSYKISNATALSMLRTSHGQPVQSSSEATAITYHGCIDYCGTGQESFNWSVFSQEYSAWLLPYLALLSQLPFGAPRMTDNLMSGILTLGSPTLASYSLYLTLLNARWANDQLFAGIDYPDSTVRQHVVQTLISLQQVPLRIHPGLSARFESLVVHPDNDEWWATLASELDYSHTWSIASATSILWVVIAYLLTVADSLYNVADNINSNGVGTGSVWLWLLPIVVGWLILSPKCDYGRVHDAYNKANRQVFVADSSDPTAVPAHNTSNFGLTINPSPDWELHNRYITSPDELRTPPVFYYSRTLSWSRTAYLVSLFYRAAWRKSDRRVGVDGKRIPWNVHNDIPRESRLGTANQVIRYCQPDNPGIHILWPKGMLFNMIVASLMSLQLQWGTTASAVLTAWFTPTTGLGCRSLAYLLYGLLSTAVWFLLVLSSILGYYARHLIDDDLPSPDSENDNQSTVPSGIPNQTRTVGTADDGFDSPAGEHDIPLLEVRTEAHTLREEEYITNMGESAAAITRNQKCSSLRGSVYARAIARFADFLRWAGKLLAIINAIGIITNSIFQYAGVYDTCYCNSSVYTWGSSAFNVITPIQDDIQAVRSAWIGALALALICCTFFVGTIYLLRDSLPS